MKKRIFALVLSFCLILSLMPAVYAAGTDVTMNTNVTAGVRAGDEFTVTVTFPAVSGTKKAYAIGMQYEYNKDVFTVKNFSAPSYNGTEASASNASDGIVSCTYMGASGENTIDCSAQVQFVATFTVNAGAAPGAYDFALNTTATMCKYVEEDGYTEVDLVTVAAGTKTSVTVLKAPIASVTASVAQPVKGAALASDVDLGGATAYTGTVEWFEGTVASGTPVTGNAKAEQVYTAKITLTANSGESFAASVTAPADYTLGEHTASKVVLTRTFAQTGDKDALTGTVSVTGVPKIGQPLTATPAGLPADAGTLTYKWYRVGSTTPISGANGSTYTPSVAADVDARIRVEVSAANYSGAVSGETTVAVSKKDAPGAPTGLAKVDVTATTITVTPNSTWEYSRDDGATWQDSNVFEGLTPDSTYSAIVARVKETDIQKPSAKSSKISVTTSKAPIASVTASVAQPVKGTALASDVDLGGATAYTGVVQWFEGNAASGAPVTGNAKAEQIYTAKITLTANSGESFAASVTAPAGYTLGERTADKVVLTRTFAQTGDKETPVINTLPTASGITYGQTLNHSTLSGGSAGVLSGTFSWKNGTIAPKVSDSDSTAYEVIFTPDDTDNYTTATCTVKLTVSKGTYSGAAISAIKEVRTNTAVAGVEVDMTALLPNIEGAAVSAATVTADPANFIRNCTHTGNTVKFDVESIADAGKEATILVTISSDNYQDISATITVKTIAKGEAGVSIAGAPASKTYGDAPFTLTGRVTAAGTGAGVWTWSSSDPAVLQIVGSGESVTVKVLKAGSAAITARYESGSTVGQASTAAITVGKAAITVKAKDQNIYVNGTAPSLDSPAEGTHYTVEGLVSGDTLGGAITMKYQKEGVDATPDVTQAGTYSIVIGGVTADTDKYQPIAFVPGTLTISSFSGGSVPAPASYSVNVDKTENGTVSVSAKSAAAGTSVILTVTPDKGYQLERLTVLDQDGKELKLTGADGKYVFTMPASKVTVKATFMDDNTMLNYFVDVKAGDYFYDAVLWAVEKGITNGTDAEHFSPDGACTRAQIVTFLWRAAGSPEPKGAASFTDVPADSYYAKAVAWAVEAGITGGTGEGKFSPDDTCTREQAVTFLYRASGRPAVDGGSAFQDVEADAYYADAVAWAEKKGVTGGIGGGLFGTGDACTRAQIVTFLYRAQAK